MRNRRLTQAAIAIAAATAGGVAIAASGGSTSHTARANTLSATRSAATTMRVPSGLDVVRTARATVQGTSESILVDAKGLPLYIYKPDTPTTSHVTGQLAALWPPLLAPHRVPQGADSVLTSVATSNGEQIAYRGHLLYTFVEDTPGHVTGQGVQDFFVATPGLISGASTTTPTSPAPPISSYSY